MNTPSFALSPNTVYTAHSVRQNFGCAETSYTLETIAHGLIVSAIQTCLT